MQNYKIIKKPPKKLYAAIAASSSAAWDESEQASLRVILAETEQASLGWWCHWV